MNFNEKFSSFDPENFLIGNLIGIFYKAYMMYLNNKIEDLNIDIEEIPFILELNQDDKENINTSKNKQDKNFNLDNNSNNSKSLTDSAEIRGKTTNKTKDELGEKIANENFNERISQDELLSRLFSSKRKAIMACGKLEYFGIIEIKSSKDDDEKFEIFLTDYGKEIANKIKKIDVEWQELIYENLESADKDVVINSLKELAISSLKANEKENISQIDESFFRDKSKDDSHYKHFKKLFKDNCHGMYKIATENGIFGFNPYKKPNNYGTPFNMDYFRGFNGLRRHFNEDCDRFNKSMESSDKFGCNDRIKHFKNFKDERRDYKQDYFRDHTHDRFDHPFFCEHQLSKRKNFYKMFF